MALTAEELGERAIRKGDEVITVAAAFPTTVSPIVQFGAVPVFVDIDIETLNIDISAMEGALSSKTKAVFLAHTLGNPFDLKAVKAFCDKNNLWLIEDNCDALGAEFVLPGGVKLTGTVGDIGTSSFYPAHHMTTGEGGAVYTDNPLLYKLMMSFRDWGRDCVCPGGTDNMCGHRFDRQYGELPKGYDHKYVYSHFGYNLKMTDIQAAIGAAQIDKLPVFAQKRRENADYLYELLLPVKDRLVLPKVVDGAKPAWFGFPITVREGLKRADVVGVLERNKVQTRNLFSGNMLRHPCFDAMRKSGEGYRVAGGLANTERTVYDTFWIGVYPGMSKPMLEFMAEVILGAADY
jgi:CDP-6-deoxy-D-xylo-4-hexulose-3-dehydrase